MYNAGLISLGGYLPGKKLREKKQVDALTSFLKTQTHLHPDYITEMECTGALPGHIETNAEGWINQPWYEAWLSTLPEKKRAAPFQGAVERRRVPLDPNAFKESLHPHPMLSSDAETLAGAMAITQAQLEPSEIDLVLVSSLVPDRHVPLNASLVQYKLGLTHSSAYNIDTCCSSFITMLEVASHYVRLGLRKNVLIIASSLDSIINDKSTYYSVVTGDAAIAGIVSQTEPETGYLASHSTSCGERHQAIIFDKRKPQLLRHPTQGCDYQQDYVTFYDQELCKEIAIHAQEDLTHVVDKTLEKASFSREDLDFFITHQPVAWAPEIWREGIGIDEKKTHHTFEKYANIACCCAPVNLLEAIEEKKIKAGDHVMMASSGVGENHIALLAKISPTLLRNIHEN